MPAIMEYAGVELPLATPEAAGWIAKYIDPRDVFDNDLFVPPWGNSTPTKGDERYLPPIQLHTLRWPRGLSRWATFHATVDGETLAALRTALADFYPTKTKTNVPRLKLGDGENEITAAMFMLPAKPLSGIPGQWYLITLVDERYYWQGNLVNPSVTGYTHQTPTWLNLLSVGTLNIREGFATVDAVPAAYQTPNASRWNRRPDVLRPAFLLDQAAEACGARWVRRLTDGVRVCQRYENALPVHDAIFDTYAHQTEPPPANKQNYVVAGGQYDAQEMGRQTPVVLGVVFENTSGSPADGRYYNGPSANDTEGTDSGRADLGLQPNLANHFTMAFANTDPPSYGNNLGGGNYVVTPIEWSALSFPNGEFPTGSTHFFDPLVTATSQGPFLAADYPYRRNRIYTIGSTLGPNNVADEAANTFETTEATKRGNFARQLATDWYGWRCRAADVLFAGILPLTPNGYADLIEWKILATDAGIGGTTRYVAGTHNYFGHLPRPTSSAAGSAYELSNAVEIPQPGYLNTSLQAIHGPKAFRDHIIAQYRKPGGSRPLVGRAALGNMPFPGPTVDNTQGDTSFLVLEGGVGSTTTAGHAAYGDPYTPQVLLTSGLVRDVGAAGVNKWSGRSIISGTVMAGLEVGPEVGVIGQQFQHGYTMLSAARSDYKIGMAVQGAMFEVNTNTPTGFLGKWPSSKSLGGVAFNSNVLVSGMDSVTPVTFGCVRSTLPGAPPGGVGPFVNLGKDADVAIPIDHDDTTNQTTYYVLQFRAGLFIHVYMVTVNGWLPFPPGQAGQALMGGGNQVAEMGAAGEFGSLTGGFTQRIDETSPAEMGAAGKYGTVLLNGSDIQFNSGLDWD
jgi:hypothetical protein